MGALTLPINFLAHAGDPPKPGDIQRAIAAAELFARCAGTDTLGERFLGTWPDHDAPYVRQVQFNVDDPEMRDTLEALAHELAAYCWRDAGTSERRLQ